MNFQCFDREIWIPSGFLVNRAFCCVKSVANAPVVKLFEPGEIRKASFAIPISGDALLLLLSPMVVDLAASFNLTALLAN